MLNDETWFDMEFDEFSSDTPEPPVGATPDELDAWVDKRLAAMRALDRQMARNLRYYERRKEELDAWLERENGKLQLLLRSEEHTSELQSREKLVCRL